MCNGMQNAHVTFSMETHKEEIHPVNKNDHQPFNVPHCGDAKSFSVRSWSSVAAASELSHRALSGKGNWDGRNKHIHMHGANCEFFCCLSQQLKGGLDECALEKKRQFRRAKKRLLRNLAVANKRMRHSVELVRVPHEKELGVLRSLFGSGFAVANTGAVPTMKQTRDLHLSDTVQLMEQDQVRIVTCAPIDKDLNVLKCQCPLEAVSSGPSVDNHGLPGPSMERMKNARLCSFPGIDIEFIRSETGLCDLHLNLKFKKFLGKSDTVRRAQSVGKASSVNAEDSIAKERMPAVVGGELKHGGAVHSILGIDSEKNTVSCAETGRERTGPSLTLTIEDATNRMNVFLDEAVSQSP